MSKPRVLHSAVTAYLVLAIGVIGSIGYAQHSNTQFNNQICVIAKSSWDERNVMVNELTNKTSLPRGLDPNDPATKALQKAVDNGNVRRKNQRTYLLKLQGPRPTC